METETQETGQARERTSALLECIRKGKVVHDSFSTEVRSRYLVSGRTIQDWEKEFRISLPGDPDPSVCRSLLGRLLTLHAEATFHLAHARIVNGSMGHGVEARASANYQELTAGMRDASGKVPAAKTLEVLSRAGMEDLEGALACAKIAESFWKDILEHLAYCRKVLEDATIAAGVEAKLHQQYGG